MVHVLNRSMLILCLVSELAVAKGGGGHGGGHSSGGHSSGHSSGHSFFHASEHGGEAHSVGSPSVFHASESMQAEHSEAVKPSVRPSWFGFHHSDDEPHSDYPRSWRRGVHFSDEPSLSPYSLGANSFSATLIRNTLAFRPYSHYGHSYSHMASSPNRSADLLQQPSTIAPDFGQCFRTDDLDFGQCDVADAFCGGDDVII